VKIIIMLVGLARARKCNQGHNYAPPRRKLFAGLEPASSASWNEGTALSTSQAISEALRGLEA